MAPAASQNGAGSLDGVRRIVVVLPTWVGDTVMATPALRALRRAAPDAELVVFGRPLLFGLLEGGDLFDRAVANHKGKGRVRANVAALREIGADLAVILPHSFRTAWEVFRAGIPRRVGYRREGRGWMLTESIAPHRVRGKIVPVPMVFQYLELVALLGAVPDGDGPKLPVSEELRARGDAALRELGVDDTDRLIVLNPGASFGPSKIWPVEYLSEVADHFMREGAKVLILCGPGEEELGATIAELCEGPVIDTGRAVLPLDITKPVLARANLMITTDAGPRHVSVSQGTPTIVLMGPTDPRYTDSHLGESVVLRRDVPCGPCHLKVCPLDHRCLREIRPAEVIEWSERLIRA